MSKTPNPSVLIVMPAYNEATRIGAVINGLPKQLAIKKKTFLVKTVVVDDHSADKTSQVAKEAGAIVLRHVLNSGAGAATRTGLRYAESLGDSIAYVVTIDADGQHSIDDIIKIVTFAVEHESQMIVGNRLHEGNRDSMPTHRHLGNLGLTVISRVLFNITTQDTQSGLRLFKADILPIIADYTIDRYGFCTEMLWMAFRAGVQVDEMPISVSYSEATLKKGQSNWGAVELIKDLMWIRVSR